MGSRIFDSFGHATVGRANLLDHDCWDLLQILEYFGTDICSKTLVQIEKSFRGQNFAD